MSHDQPTLTIECEDCGKQSSRLVHVDYTCDGCTTTIEVGGDVAEDEHFSEMVPVSGSLCFDGHITLPKGWVYATETSFLCNECVERQDPK